MWIAEGITEESETAKLELAYGFPPPPPPHKNEIWVTRRLIRETKMCMERHRKRYGLITKILENLSWGNEFSNPLPPLF